MVQRLILHFLFVFLVIVSIYEAVCTLETLLKRSIWGCIETHKPTN